MTEAADADRIGGKAAGLIRLAAAGVRVPWWIVVPTEAFARHIAGIDPGRPAAQVRTRILSTPVDDELAATLTDRLAGRGPFAVRSSVVGEDSDSHSFAGAFDTYLYLGVDAVVDAVRRCWASAFNDRAVAYRRNAAAGTAPPAVAVIVQEMAEGDISGVLFTRNPLSGRDDEILVSAGWGLGEGIVSGQVDTDQYIWSHAGLELSATIADKATRVVRRAGRVPHARGAGAAGPAFRSVLEPRPVARIDLCGTAGRPPSRRAAGHRMDRPRQRCSCCCRRARSLRRPRPTLSVNGESSGTTATFRRVSTASPVALSFSYAVAVYRDRSPAHTAHDRRSRSDARGIRAGAAQHDRPRLGPGLLQHQQLVSRPASCSRRSTATRRISNTSWASSTRSTS